MRQLGYVIRMLSASARLIMTTLVRAAADIFGIKRKGELLDELSRANAAMRQEIRVPRETPLPVVEIVVVLKQNPTAKKRRKIQDELARRVAERFYECFPVTSALYELKRGFEDPYRLEVTVHEGSLLIKIRVTALAMLVALSSYGSAKAGWLGNDMQRFCEDCTELTYKVVGEEEIAHIGHGGSWLGAIAGLDASLRRCKQNEIDERTCADELRTRFAVIAESREAQPLIASVIRYLDFRYGDFPVWTMVRQGLGFVSGSPEAPLARQTGDMESDQQPTALITHSIMRIELITKRRMTVEETALLHDGLLKAIRAQVDPGGTGIELQPNIEVAGTKTTINFWIVLSSIAGFLVMYPKLRAGLARFRNDVNLLREKLECISSECNPGLEVVDFAPTMKGAVFVHVQKLVVLLGERDRPREDFKKSAEVVLRQIKQTQVRCAVRKIVDDYIQRAYADDKPPRSTD